MILRHPIAVSSETATYSQVVAERANIVGLFVGAKLNCKNPGLAKCPTKALKVTIESSIISL